jgi:ATP:ADP antiporter, AAA family
LRGRRGGATLSDAIVSETPGQQRTWVHAGLRPLVDVRAGELGAMLYASLYFFALLAANYILRPVRDDMGLIGGTKNLPWLFLGTLTAVLLSQPLFAALVSRFPRRQFIPGTYRFFELNLLGFAALVWFLPPAQQVYVGRAFYIWMSVFNLFVVAVFWGFMADLFASGQGQRLFGFIGAGGTLGGVAGSEAAKQCSTYFGEKLGHTGVACLLVAALLLLELAVFCAGRLARRGHAIAAANPDRPTAAAHAGSDAPLRHGGMLGGIVAVFRSPYLLALAGYMLAMTISSTFLYMKQGTILESVARAERVHFLASIDQYTNIITLLMQLGVVGHLVPLIGVGVAAALMPVLTGAGMVLVYRLDSPLALMIAQVGRRVAEYGLTRPAREVFYTVVPRAQKYKAKTFIDTFVYRGGDALGGQLWGWLGGAAHFGTITLVTLVGALGWIALSLGLGRAQGRRAAGVRAGADETAVVSR